MLQEKQFIVTGGAGYIGSIVTASLLASGQRVSVIDRLDFGADSLLGFWTFSGFKLIEQDITQANGLAKIMAGATCVIHLAALVGFPVCQQAGPATTWQVNVEGTRHIYEAARQAGVERLIYASSYSNYGIAPEGATVTEDSPLHPQSSYAESKVAAEQYLLEQAARLGPAITCLRLATVFGVSPRTRFDLMVNQFAWQAHCGETLLLYQQDFRRAFVHVSDVARAIRLVADAPQPVVNGQVFNVGHEKLNSSKQELIHLIRERWPLLKVELRDTSFGGDMRSLHVSFEKIQRILGFTPQVDLRQGIAELYQALNSHWIHNPAETRYRNHPPLLV